MLAIVVMSATACASGERTAPAVEPAVVPSLTGRPAGEAVTAVRDAGLRAEVTPSPCPSGTVAAQDAAPGTALVRGSTVTLTVTGCPP